MDTRGRASTIATLGGIQRIACHGQQISSPVIGHQVRRNLLPQSLGKVAGQIGSQQVLINVFLGFGHGKKAFVRK